MKCPADNAELTTSNRQGVDVNFCPECRGVWLSKDDLDKVVRASAEAGAEAAQTPSDRQETHHLGTQSRPRGRTAVEDIFNLP